MVTERIRLLPTLTNAIFDMAVVTSETDIDVDRSAGLEFRPLRWICHPRRALSNYCRKFYSQVQIHRLSSFSIFFYRKRKSFPPIFERNATLMPSCVIKSIIIKAMKRFSTFSLFEFRSTKTDNFMHLQWNTSSYIHDDY